MLALTPPASPVLVLCNDAGSHGGGDEPLLPADEEAAPPVPVVATLRWLMGPCSIEEMVAHLHRVPEFMFVDDYAKTVADDRPGMRGNCGPALTRQPVVHDPSDTRHLRIPAFVSSGAGRLDWAKESVLLTTGKDAIQREGLHACRVSHW